MNKIRLLVRLPFARKLLNNRFIKFGTVGFSGTLVNLGFLYLGQEVIFKSVDSVDQRLSFSIVLAIVCATINNFTWNRSWTWGDRTRECEKHFIIQLGQYFVACWLAITLQFVLTKILADHIYYLTANVIAIVMASVVNFLVNDAWTFGTDKIRALRRESEPLLERKT